MLAPEKDGDEDSTRGRSLDRFEQSLKRLDPPAWIRQQSPLPPVALQPDPNRTRPRYSDHRRSYSAQRSGTAVPSSSTSFWRNTLSSSREPSPGPGSRPATAAGRFQTSQFSRWSASTLCSDGQFSNGDNTPTDSVISAFSMRSSLHNTEPIYHPPPLINRPSTHHTKRPYLGWRSQDSLINESSSSRSSASAKCLTPAERLAQSYRRGNTHQQGSSAQNNHRRQRLLSGQQHQLVHDSIKSVSTAIMEFCQAEDVPPPPPPTASGASTLHRRRKENRAQIVWLESSFVSSGPAEPKSKL